MRLRGDCRLGPWEIFLKRLALNDCQGPRKRKEDIHGKTNSKKGRDLKKKKKTYFFNLSFYPLTSSPQSAELSELRAGVISEWGRRTHFLFSHSSRLSQS